MCFVLSSHILLCAMPLVFHFNLDLCEIATYVYSHEIVYSGWFQKSSCQFFSSCIFMDGKAYEDKRGGWINFNSRE